MKSLFVSASGAFLLLLSAACHGDTEIATYDVLKDAGQNNIELRNYPQLVLVSTPMNAGRNSAFSRLFNYISGNNTSRDKIAMTAPVFMGETLVEQQPTKNGEKIAMTAPVFRSVDGDSVAMSFVLPASYTEETAPLPKNSLVKLHTVKDLTVAAIRFNGTMGRRNMAKHREILEDWVSEQGYKVIGAPMSAGYNAPYTLPMLRRNEVLIPVALTE